MEAGSRTSTRDKMTRSQQVGSVLANLLVAALLQRTSPEAICALTGLACASFAVPVRWVIAAGDEAAPGPKSKAGAALGTRALLRVPGVASVAAAYVAGVEEKHHGDVSCQ